MNHFALLTLPHCSWQSKHCIACYSAAISYTYGRKSLGRNHQQQESLANAKVSVRQQCMYEGP